MFMLFVSIVTLVSLLAFLSIVITLGFVSMVRKQDDIAVVLHAMQNKATYYVSFAIGLLIISCAVVLQVLPLVLNIAIYSSVIVALGVSALIVISTERALKN